MNLNDYQTAAVSTAIYNEKFALMYPILGLANEAGEVAGKYKKILRDWDGYMGIEECDSLAKELSDVLWYLAVVSHDLGYDLDDIAQMNLDKLQDRKQRGVLRGSGDNR